MNSRYEDLRERMIALHLLPRGITNKRIIEAFRKVPREVFVPDYLKHSAYEDSALPIGHGQTISQPYIVARMLQLLDPQEGDTVLEIGTGSGYQTALLAELSSTVVTIERLKPLLDSAKRTLESLGYKNIVYVHGDGTLGYKPLMPYDRIIVSAGAPHIPQTLVAQLKTGGILVAPVGSRFMQVLTRVEKKEDGVYIEEDEGCVFVPLIGKKGWETNGA